MPKIRSRPNVSYRCSVCAKGQEQVHRLIAGPGGVYICNECIALCNQIFAEEGMPRQAGRDEEQTSWRSFARQASEAEGARQDALSAVHSLGNLIAGGDYKAALVGTIELLEIVVELRERSIGGEGVGG